MITFFLVGLTAVVCIVLFIDKQSRKVNSILKHNTNVQPMLQIRTSQHKIRQIEARLQHVPADKQQKVRMKMETITAGVRNKDITLRTCNNELDQLLKQLNIG
jgi:division protein CdvB (Snf7/Vps24/ESCRT-III family)